MRINIMNYMDYAVNLDIDAKDVDHIDVAVVTGDELMAIYGHDGKLLGYFDAAEVFGDPRRNNFADEHYTVTKEDIPEWLNRKDTYDWGWDHGSVIDPDYFNFTPFPIAFLC